MIVVTEMVCDAAGDLEIFGQCRDERGEIVSGARVRPDFMRERCGARIFRHQFGGQFGQPPIIFTHHANQAGFIAVIRRAIDLAFGSVEQACGLVASEQFMADSGDGFQHRRARLGAARRHQHLLIPTEQRFGGVQMFNGA